MAIKNINTIQHTADLDFIKSQSNEYLLQSLANSGQRLGIQGDGVKINNFNFCDILPYGDKYNPTQHIGYIKRSDDKKSFTIGIKDKENLLEVDTPVEINNPIGYIIYTDEFTIDEYDLIKYSGNGKIYYDGNNYAVLLKGITSTGELNEVLCEEYDKSLNTIKSAIRLVNYNGIPTIFYIEHVGDNDYTLSLYKAAPQIKTLNEYYTILSSICNDSISPSYIINRLVNNTNMFIVTTPGSINLIYNPETNVFTTVGYDAALYGDFTRYIQFFIYDLTYLYRYIKTYFSEIVFKDNNLMLKQQMLAHVVNMILGDSLTNEVYIPLNYSLNYACNDNNEWQIYYNTTDIIVRYMPETFTPEYIQKTVNESTWLCHTDLEERVSLYNLSVNYDEENTENVYDINVFKHYTLPYINNDGYWVLNDTVSDIYARGKDAGQPNIIIVNSYQHTYDIVSGANRKLLNSIPWTKSVAYVEPLETTNLNDLTLKSEFDWLKVEYFIPDLENISTQNIDECLTALEGAIIINVANINCVDYSNNVNYTKEDVVDRYGKYGVITTIWNVDIEHKRCDYLRRDDNTRCAADFNYITNMNNIINWAIKTHEPKHPDKYKFSYLTFDSVFTMFKNNETETRTYIYPNICNKKSTEYNSINYNNDFNISIKYNDTVYGAEENNITNIQQSASTRYLTSQNTTTTNSIYKITYTDNEYYKEYVPNYNVPTLDLSEVIVRDENVLNKVNIISLDKRGNKFNSYIGTSFENDDKSSLIIGTSDTNINIGNSTLVETNTDYKLFTEQNNIKINFPATYISNNQYVGENLYINNNIVHTGLDWTKYNNIYDNSIVTYWTTSFIPTSRYIYEKNSYIYENWGIEESEESYIYSYAGIVRLNVPTAQTYLYNLAKVKVYNYTVENNKLYTICTIPELYSMNNIIYGEHNIYIGDGIYIPALLNKLQLSDYIKTDSGILDFSNIHVYSKNMNIYSYNSTPLILQSVNTLLYPDKYEYVINTPEDESKPRYETIVHDYTYSIFKGNTLNITYWVTDSNKTLHINVDECQSQQLLSYVNNITLNY